jgi:hypothetical protein
MYTISDQPGIPDKQKKIVKTEDIVREKHLTIEDLLWEHNNLCAEICSCQMMANDIVDELIAINKILPVGDIPEKIKQEKK